MKVTLYNRQRDLPISAQSVKWLISFLFTALAIESDEIILHFVTDKKMRTLHDTFFADPTSTDCITFPLDPPQKKSTRHTILGEIFVCPRTACAYAEAHQLNPYDETARYLIHGLLHLLGYDDLEPANKKKMRRQENRCLALLEKEGLLQKFRKL